MKGWSSAKVPDLISVIVTTYNREDALEAVLSSLSRQSDRGFEVVVADDGSRATTAAVVPAIPPHSGVRGGRSGALALQRQEPLWMRAWTT